MSRRESSAGVNVNVWVAPGGDAHGFGDADRCPGRGLHRGRQLAGLARRCMVGDVGLERERRAGQIRRVVLHDVRVAQRQRAGRVQLDRELDAGVVVGRDLRPVDVVEREHRVRVVRVDLERERVHAGSEQARDVERVPRVVALHRVLSRDLRAVDPHVRLPDDPVDDQVGVPRAARLRDEVGPEPPGHVELRDRVRPDRVHVAETVLHVVGEEHLGTVPGLDERAHLGSDRAGIVGADVEPRARREARRRDLGAGLRRLRAALDLPPAEPNGLGVGRRRLGADRSRYEQGEHRRGEQGQPTTADAS